MFRHNKGFLSLALAVCLHIGAAIPALSAQVSGNVVLIDGTDHSGIAIIANAASPSAVTDSTYSDINGDYGLNVSSGVYDVVFRKAGYITQTLASQLVVAPVVLTNVTMLPESRNLSGAISGSLLAGAEYLVIGNISVANGDTLDIQPGTTLRFMGNYIFNVDGLLRANGAVADSIYFTSGQASPSRNDWSRIHFRQNSDPHSFLRYCRINYAGDAVAMTNTSATLSNCLISDSAKGVYFFPSGGAVPNHYPVVENCVIERMIGAGILIGGGEFTVAVRQDTIRNCHDGVIWYGGGLNYDPGTISRCVIENITAYGIQCAAGVTGTIDYTRVSSGSGQGIYVQDNCTPVINHCVINDNTGSNIYIRNASPVITQSTIFGGSTGIGFSGSGVTTAHISSNIISASFALGLVPSRAASSQILYNCLVSTYPGYYPPNVGNLLMTNANGDSCDIYLNIVQDPQMADPLAGDYSLLATSPCIDAGDPSLALDTDNTVADMGAFYYSHIAAGTPERLVAKGVYLGQNTPNPFNPATMIHFSQDTASPVRLEILDIAGRRVRRLIAGQQMAAGDHTVLWNGRDEAGRAVSSGVYFYRLETVGASFTKTMTLVR